MSKRFLIILAALVLVFVGFVAFSKRDKQTGNGSNNSSVSASNHTRGEGKSGVVLIEYGDFECPACAQYYPVIEQVFEKYKEDITFQFRHFPLVQIHKNAMVGHRAAEAAAKQGKFWEMYNVLYSQQTSWSQSNQAVQVVESYAKQLGLNMDRFKKDFASEEINAIINADLAEAQKIKATGTPTFVLDGKKIESPGASVENFSKILDKAIAEKTKQ